MHFKALKWHDYHARRFWIMWNQKIVLQNWFKNVTDLTCISNNAGVDDFGLGPFFAKRQIKK
jgi:hypothetical protein